MATIHWIGGNLPQVGKSWATRALTESLCLKDDRAAPLVVDTSPNSILTRVYNPDLLKSTTPDRYFHGDGLFADEIFDLVEHHTLVVKLVSHSQASFLEWLRISGILNEDIRHHFWFISNGHRAGIQYFQEICEYAPWQIAWVRNHHAPVWDKVAEIETDLFQTCDLSGIISNPAEIQFIEDTGSILSELADPQNDLLPILTRIRIQRFLKHSCQNFTTDEVETKIALHQPLPPPIAIEEDEEEEDIRN